MNRGQLIDAVVAATELPRTQVEATITATLAQVRGTVASGEKVQLPGFGTFEPRERGARTARNPSTGAQLQLAATRAVGFKVGATFKQVVDVVAVTFRAAWHMGVDLGSFDDLDAAEVGLTPVSRQAPSAR